MYSSKECQKSNCSFSKCIRGPIGPQGSPSPGSIIPFASGHIPIEISQLNNLNRVAAIGFWSSAGATITLGTIDISTIPYLIGFAFTMPRSGTLTNISGNFTTTLEVNFDNPAFINAQLYVADPGSSTYHPLGFVSVNLGGLLNGTIPAGTTLFDTQDLGVPVLVGQQLLMIVTTLGSPETVITGIFSGGINII